MILGPELQIPVLPAAPGRELPAEGALAGEGEAGLGAGQRRLSGRRPLVPGEAADPSFSIVWRISRVLSVWAKQSPLPPRGLGRSPRRSLFQASEL